MKSIDGVSVYRYYRIEHRLRIGKGGGILASLKFFYGQGEQSHEPLPIP